VITTRATILTAPGPGAIGVMQVIGPEAFAAVAARFRTIQGGGLRRGPSRMPRFGRMGHGKGDEVVVLIVNPSEIEIHAHGGPVALDSVLDDLRAEGVAVESPEAKSEFDRLLARAATLRVVDVLLDQSDGAFDREMARLGTLKVDDRRGAVHSLLRLAEFGLRLDRGWSVVLVGRPNVGKSRLLNTIAGFDRAIVSPIEGTTRDVVTARIAIDGWPVDLSDTAGIRESPQAVEASGITLANEARARADLVVVVLDRSCPMTRDDHELIASFPDALLVANKSDVRASWFEREVGALAISAATHEGLAQLLATISTRIVPSPPPPGTVVPVLCEDRAWLESLAIELAATS